jgi:hypothetical protein
MRKRGNLLLLSLRAIKRINMLSLEEELSNLYRIKQNKEKKLSKDNQEGIH